MQSIVVQNIRSEGLDWNSMDMMWKRMIANTRCALPQ